MLLAIKNTVIVFGLITFGFSTTIYIPNDYSTIQEGIDASENGDEIIVAPGTYVENLYVNKQITLTSHYSYDQDTSFISQTIIDGNNSGTTVRLQQLEVLFSGFTIINGSGDNSGRGGGVYIFGGNSTISNCIIKNNTASKGGGIYAEGATGSVIDVVISNNSVTYSGAGVCVLYRDLTLVNVLIKNNSGGQSAYHLYDSLSPASMQNCTVVNNDSQKGVYIDNEGDIDILNTIVINNNGDELFEYNATSIDVNYSNIAGEWSGEGNINLDPLFCSPDSNNFYLAENSPCVGTGENGANMGAFDVGCEPIFNMHVFHVDTSGSDETGDGTEANPFRTIGFAKDFASPNDTVLVAPGTYEEYLLFNDGTNYVVGSHFLTTQDTNFISQTIIDANWATSVVFFSEGIDSTTLFTGFTLTRGTTSLEGGGGMKIQNNASPIISNVKITGNSAFKAGGVLLRHTASPTFIDVVIDGNTSTTYGGGGVSCANSSSPTFINTKIIYNTVTGGNMSGGGIQVYNDAQATLINCLIANNTSGGDGDGLSAGNNASVTLINSTIVYNDGQGIYNSPSSESVIHLTNTIVWGNPIEADEGSVTAIYSDIEGGWDGEGNIDFYPNFCDPENGDYTLAEDSECLGAGQDGADIGAFGVGCEELSTDRDINPSEFMVHQNYPNPFNPTTTLRYDLPDDGKVNITIYDMMGRVVRNLVNDHQTNGYKTIHWNGTNGFGEPVAAGVYLYQIKMRSLSTSNGDAFVQTKKMILLK